MMSCKEQRCIDAAKEAKIHYAKRRLDEFCKKVENFESPFIGIGDALSLKLNPTEKIKQLAFMPICFIMLCLFTPLIYAIHLIESRDKIRCLKEELAHEKTRIEDLKAPKVKTLRALWEICGLERHKYTHDERIDLLSKWIEILYGKETLERLGIDRMVHAIGVKNLNLNIPYFECEEYALHYGVRAIVDILIEKLSEDLPVYELVK